MSIWARSLPINFWSALEDSASSLDVTRLFTAICSKTLKSCRTRKAMNLPIYAGLVLDVMLIPHLLTQNVSLIRISSGFCNAVTKPDAAVSNRTRHFSKIYSFYAATVAASKAFSTASIVAGGIRGCGRQSVRNSEDRTRFILSIYARLTQGISSRQLRESLSCTKGPNSRLRSS